MHGAIQSDDTRPFSSVPGRQRDDADERTLDRLPTFLTVAELASLLRVDRNSAYQAVARGEIPGARRIGKTIRITRDVVVEWLRGNGGVPRSSRSKR